PDRLARCPWYVLRPLDHRASVPRLAASEVSDVVYRAQQSAPLNRLAAPNSAPLKPTLGLFPKLMPNANSHGRFPADNVLRHLKWHHANHSRLWVWLVGNQRWRPYLPTWTGRCSRHNLHSSDNSSVQVYCISYLSSVI